MALSSCSRSLPGDIGKSVQYYKSAGIAYWWDALALYDAGADLNDFDFSKVIPQDVSSSDYLSMAKYLLLRAVFVKAGATEIWDPNTVQQYLVGLETILVDNGPLASAPLNTVIYGAMAVLANSNPGDFDTTALKAFLLSRQQADGGFSLNTPSDGGDTGATATPSDIDTTASLIPLLRLFAANAGVSDAGVSQAALDSAVGFLQQARNKDSKDYDNSSSGIANSNSTAFALSAAVCANSDGSRNGWADDTLNALFTYRLSNGSFEYIKNNKSDSLATAQSLMAVCDYNNNACLFYTLISGTGIAASASAGM